MSESTATSTGRRIIRGMFVLIFFWLFWKVGGLLMMLIISGCYGAGPVMDGDPSSSIWTSSRPIFAPARWPND